MAVAIYWPDGAVTRAATPTEALQTIAEKQWEQALSVAELKHVLAARAYGWNRASVDATLSDTEFLLALGETGMVFVNMDSDGLA